MAKKIRLFVFNIVLWFVKQYTIITAYILGTYRYVFFFKVGHVYQNKHNHIYYKYLGDCHFKEGNKYIDNGTFQVEVPGNDVMFSIFALGFFKWEKYV